MTISVPGYHCFKRLQQTNLWNNINFSVQFTNMPDIYDAFITNKWATSWQNHKMTFAPSKDSDQPGRIRSAWASAQSDQGLHWDAQADLSLRWAHTDHTVGFVMRQLKYARHWFMMLLLRTNCHSPNKFTNASLHLQHKTASAARQLVQYDASPWKSFRFTSFISLENLSRWQIGGWKYDYLENSTKSSLDEMPR